MASILLADDVALARDTLARALRDRGHRVSVVGDGQAAVERFVRDRSDLAIFDLMMPRLGGLEACARLKAESGGCVPVIIVSARTDLDTRVAALAIADDFVPKPFEVPEVCARVEAHLRMRRLLEQARGAAAAARGEATTQPIVPPPGADEWPGRPIRAVAGTPRLLDREAFLARLGDEWRRCGRSNDPLAVVVVGFDFPAGAGGEPSVDSLLAAMQRSLRSHDLVARIDDLHGAGLLSATHMTGAMAVAERLRRELRRPTPGEGAPSPVSMGFALFPNRDVTDSGDLLRIAQQAIARAREAGPGRICLWQNQGYLYDPPE